MTRTSALHWLKLGTTVTLIVFLLYASGVFKLLGWAVNYPGADGWSVIDNGLQMVSALAWLGVSHRFAGSVTRILYGEGRPRDAAGAFACLTGITQTMFTLRWLWLGTADMREMSMLSLQVWSVCYVMSLTSAVGLLYSLQEHTVTVPYIDGEANVRARKGVLAWAIVLILSIALAWAAR